MNPLKERVCHLRLEVLALLPGLPLRGHELDLVPLLLADSLIHVQQQLQLPRVVQRLPVHTITHTLIRDNDHKSESLIAHLRNNGTNYILYTLKCLVYK